MNKKIFVILATLVAAGAMLFCITLAQYKIKFDVGVDMPKAQPFGATMTFVQTDYDVSPGDEKQTISFGVANDTETKIEYTVRIETTGHIPLEFQLDDYLSRYSRNEDGTYEFYDDDGNEIVFSDDKLFEINFGWDTTPSRSDLCDGKYRKEVELITVRVNPVNKRLGLNLLTEEEYKQKIEEIYNS